MVGMPLGAVAKRLGVEVSPQQKRPDRDDQTLQRRDTRVSEVSNETEAAMEPDLNEVNGRHAPRGCQRQLTGGRGISTTKKT